MGDGTQELVVGRRGPDGTLWAADAAAPVGERSRREER